MITETTVSIENSQRLPPPGSLWHYTTIDVLEHFLQGEIAFSHYKFLNDDSELSYGRQLLQEIFDGVESEGIKHFIKSVDDLVSDVYMFCLSRDGDNLYQWRSYTPQGGIAVAFDRQKLHSAVQEGVNNKEWVSSSGEREISGILMTCRYRDDFAKRVVLRLNQRSNKSHGACCDGCKEFGLYVEKIMKVLLSQKNPSFSEEQEERFLVMNAPRSKVTMINMKPRILVHDQGIAKSISCVRLSPHGDRERNKLFVEILRDKHKLDFKIEQSSSSYNGR